MAGILRRFGKAGYCAYQWLLDLYAIQFDSAGPDVPLVMDHKTLKRELDIKKWNDFWGLLKFVNDWPAIGLGEKQPIEPTWNPNRTHLEPAWNRNRTRIEPKNGFIDEKLNNEPNSLIPKWIYWKDEENVYIFIPNFLKTADDWTRRKMRNDGDQNATGTGAGGAGQKEALRRALRHDQRREDKIRDKGGLLPMFVDQSKPQGPPNVLASFLATAGHDLDRLGPRAGPPFNPWWFIKNALHQGHHPKAIRKGLELARDRWFSTADIEELIKDAVCQVSEQFGAAFDNQEIIKALMPTFRKTLMPKVVGQDEIKA